jgi:hypothetical protein
MHSHHASLAAAYNAFDKFHFNIIAERGFERLSGVSDGTAVTKDIGNNFIRCFCKGAMTAFAAASRAFTVAGGLYQI